MAGQLQVQGADLGRARAIGQPGLQFRPALGGGDSQVGNVDVDLLLRLSPVEEGQVGFEVQVVVVAGAAAFSNKQLAPVHHQVGEIEASK